MAVNDYYQTLGIKKEASADEIKAAYRKLARKLHPDLNPNDKQASVKFQEINQANEVLSDPDKRKKYDKYGKDWEHGEEIEKQRQRYEQQQQAANAGRRASGGGQQNFGGNFGEEEDMSDLFSSMFGNRGGGRTAQSKFKGQDYNAELTLSLKEAYTTQPKIITVNDKNIRITINAGIENGQIIKLKGYGAPGSNGGPSGDLYITFHIPNEENLKRDGNDLYRTVELDLYTAVLGGDRELDTLDGKIKLKIKPETQNGTVVRLKGKGFPVYKSEGQFGDLFVTYNIKIPTNLTEKQIDLFKELQQS